MKRMTEIDPSEVRRLIVVDVRSRRRLAHVEPVLERIDRGEPIEVHVYDHHPASDDDLAADHLVVEPLGAITTALVERLRAASLCPAPIEATLYALAIHADTGSLSLAHTTPRDVRALAWLLERGAHLPLVDRYLRGGLDEGQRAVLAHILSNAEIVEGGAALATTTLERDVDGLAEVVTEARRLAGHDALFLLAELPKQRPAVQIIARARHGSHDVAAVLKTLGGGGHRGAAAAILKDTRLEEAEARLREALAHASTPIRRVAEVMTRPAWTVDPDLTLERLEPELVDRGITGAPVMREGELVGVVSLSDVARARASGREGLPLSSHMGAPVRTIGPEASLEEALAEITERDIGRLPVVSDGELLGVVSRSDLLAYLYGLEAEG